MNVPTKKMIAVALLCVQSFFCNAQGYELVRTIQLPKLVSSLAFNADGNILVADLSDRISIYTPEGEFVGTIYTNFDPDALVVNGDLKIVRDVIRGYNGNIYVTDIDQNVIGQYSADGVFIKKWGFVVNWGVDGDSLKRPTGIQVDVNGDILVACAANNQIFRYSSSGEYISKFGGMGSGDGQFYIPMQISLDASSNIYVADKNNHRVQKLSSSGTFLTKWGSYGTGDGKFNMPIGIAVDNENNVFVANSTTTEGGIQKIHLFRGFH